MCVLVHEVVIKDKTNPHMSQWCLMCMGNSSVDVVVAQMGCSLNEFGECHSDWC